MAIPGVMTKFKIHEISGVDKPAQEGARICILKRDSTGDEPVGATFAKRDYSSAQRQELARRGLAQSNGSFPILDVADLHHAIEAYGRSSTPEETKRHITERASQLGAEHMLPEAWADGGKRERKTYDDRSSSVDGDDQENQIDKGIRKDMERGAQIRKSAWGEPVENMSPAQAIGRNQGGPGQSNGAPADLGEPTPEDYIGAVTKAARERHKADPSRSFEQHFADALATPAGQKCYALAMR
jgi:hypothetical protein